MTQLPPETTLARIDRDYLNEKDQAQGNPVEGASASESRVGTTWTHQTIQVYLRHPLLGMGMDEADVQDIEWDTSGNQIPLTNDQVYFTGLTKTRFRLKDDDGEIYYGGWLVNDPECIMQQIVLAWATKDAGCTTIEIKHNETWTQEIG